MKVSFGSAKSYKINYLYWLHNVPLVPIILHRGNCGKITDEKLLGIIVRLKRIHGHTLVVRSKELVDLYDVEIAADDWVALKEKHDFKHGQHISVTSRELWHCPAASYMLMQYLSSLPGFR